MTPRPPPAKRNVELKARLPDIAWARQVAGGLATARLPDQHQVDTYFVCRYGRLKLREIDGVRAELIGYERPDQQAPKASHYRLVPVSDAAAMKQLLAETLGIRLVVEKRREIYLHHHVRIHLDRVVGLGAFMEFEAVLGPEDDVAQGEAQLRSLQSLFGIAAADLITGSYADLAEAAAAAVRPGGTGEGAC